MFRRLFLEEEGANLVEYALLVTLIAIVVIVGVTYLGGQINDWFNALGDKISVWVGNINSAP
jgi:pilus assembly protein Flp/PilA